MVRAAAVRRAPWFASPRYRPGKELKSSPCTPRAVTFQLDRARAELGIATVSYTSISRPECARLLDDAFGQDGEF